MKTIEQIRQRRKLRINQLLDSSSPHISNESVTPSHVSSHTENLLGDPRMQDPEFYWKQRQQDLIHDSGDDTPIILKPEKRKLFFIKITLSIFILVGTLIMFELQAPWAVQGQQWLRNTLSQDFAFELKNQRYAELFRGAPSFIPTFGLIDRYWAKKTTKLVSGEITKGFHSPVQGKVTTLFSDENQIINIQTPPKSKVIALDEGRVIYVGNRSETRFTIMIQHPNNVQSLYGNIEQSNVQENDWIKGGQQIAVVSQLFFAIKVDEQYIDPLGVISVD